MEPGATPSAGADGLAAVCCEGAGELALFDLATGDRVGSIEVGSHPVHATVHRGRVFVATMGERSITAVDLDGEVTRIETGVLGPSHFAAVGDHLFVPCTAGDALAVIDAAALALEERVGIGAAPHDIVAHDDRVFVGSRDDGTVCVVDADELTAVRAVPLGTDARAQGVAVHPPSKTVLAVDQHNETLCAFACDGTAVEVRRDIGTDPYELMVYEDRVFVPGRGDGTVHQFRLGSSGPASEQLIPETTHAGFERPVEAVSLDGAIWVVDLERPVLQALDGGAIETPAPAIAATEVGDALLLSHYDDDAVSLVDPDAGVIWRSEAPAYPFGAIVV